MAKYFLKNVCFQPGWAAWLLVCLCPFKSFTIDFSFYLGPHLSALLAAKKTSHDSSFRHHFVQTFFPLVIVLCYLYLYMHPAISQTHNCHATTFIFPLWITLCHQSSLINGRKTAVCTGGEASILITINGQKMLFQHVNKNPAKNLQNTFWLKLPWRFN